MLPSVLSQSIDDLLLHNIGDLFREERIHLVSGTTFIIPNGLLAAPMESNSVANTPFLREDEIEKMDPNEIIKYCEKLVADDEYLKSNFIYGEAGRLKIGNGIPSPLVYLRTKRQAEGGWGVVFIPSSPKEEYLGTKRGLLLNDHTFPYHRKLVKVFRHYRSNANQKIMIQLTHAGWCAQVPKTFRDIFNIGIHPPEPEFIEKFFEDIEETTVLAAKAGYDGIDIKLCHGNGLADWVLHIIQDTKDHEKVNKRLEPLIELFENSRNAVKDKAGEAHKRGFAIGFRFSLFEGIPNGWGAKYDSNYHSTLRTRRSYFYNVDIDLNLPRWTILALAPYADFIHSSLGIPNITSGLLGLDKKVLSLGLNLYAANLINEHISQISKSRLNGRYIPVITSDFTKADLSAIYDLGRFRSYRNAMLSAKPDSNMGITQGKGISNASMGRQSIADPYFPIKLRDGRVKEINHCTKCRQCREPLDHQQIPSGCRVYDPVIKRIFGMYSQSPI